MSGREFELFTRKPRCSPAEIRASTSLPVILHTFTLLCLHSCIDRSQKRLLTVCTSSGRQDGAVIPIRLQNSLIGHRSVNCFQPLWGECRRHLGLHRWEEGSPLTRRVKSLEPMTPMTYPCFIATLYNVTMCHTQINDLDCMRAHTPTNKQELATIYRHISRYSIIIKS